MGIEELSGGHQHAEVPRIMRGTVVLPPLGLNGDMTVTADNYTSEDDFEVPATNWVSKAARLPLSRDPCLIFRDDEGDAWVLVGSPNG